jgi:hypothetical protein
MHPRYRPRRRLPLLLAGLALAVLAVVAAGLVIETALGGHPKANYSPPAPITHGLAGPASSTPAARPARPGPMRLVQGRELVNGVYVGYPHSTTGAVSAAAEYLTQIGSTLDPDRSAAVARLAAAPSYPDAPTLIAQGTVIARRGVNLPSSGPVPSGVSVELTPVQYQLRDVTPSQVTVLFLGDYTQTTASGTSQVSLGVWPLQMTWAAADWKLLPDQPGQGYTSLRADPGSPAAAAKGWQDLEPAGAAG